jgi:DNA processing protein
MNNHKSIIMALTEIGGVGPKTFQQLLLRFGQPENFPMATTADLADIPRLGETGSEKVLRSLDQVDRFQSKLDDYNEIGIGITTYLDDDYPELLREIDDPPPILYFKGNRDVFRFNYVALVGTTQATESGIRTAVDLARGFVKRGYGIVSGLAAGIDSAAHLGAIKEEGPTMAVLGCGILNVYPQDNIALAENIALNGLLISEYDPFRRVKAARLIVRNRLISAFSRAVIIVQVGIERRGELRTAQYANRQARPLFFADPEGTLDEGMVKLNKALTINGVDSIDDVIKYMV